MGFTLCFSQSLSAQAVTYGTQCRIKNAFGGGTDLDACERAKCSSSTVYKVSTSTKRNRDAGSGIWSFQ